MSASVDARAAELAASLVRPQVQALCAYHVADATGLIKLDAMENPYAWPEPMVAAWTQRLRGAALNRYPDPAARDLKRRLRAVMEVPSGAEILLGNGSDELIQLLVLCLGGPGRVVLAPEPSFVMYRMLASASGASFVPVPLAQPDFELDRQAMLDAMARNRPALVFLAYPNNPTGNLFDRRAVDAVIEAATGLVVIDEAYEPFARQSYMARLTDTPNLLVMRTVSKLGLAGLRLGLIAGSPGWINELEKLRLPYNINVLTQLSADFALERYDVLAAQAARIREDRARLLQELSRFRALRVWPSAANFLLCRVEGGDAGALVEALRGHGILVKLLAGASPALAGCVRISVGTPAENRALVEALEACL